MNNCIPSYAFLYENDFNTRDIDYDIDYDDDDSLSLQSNSIDTNEYKSTLFYDNNNNNNNNNNYNINMNNNMNKKKKNNNNNKKNNINNNNSISKIKLDEIDENDWENLVQQSMKKLKNFPGLPANEIISDMFTREKNRLIVKVKKIKYFQIFPWFLIDPKYKYRESTQHRDELYEALNFFWGKSLTEDDYLFIESYYKKKSPNVERCLSSILDLKRLIDNNHGAIQIKAKQNKSAPDYDNRPSKKQRFSLDDIPVHDDLLSSCFSPLQSNSITPLSSAYENLDDTDLSVYSEPINLSDVEENCDNTYSNQSKSCDNSFNKYNQCQTMLDQIQQIKNLLAPSIEDNMYMNDSDFNSLQNHIKSALLILQNNSKNY